MCARSSVDRALGCGPKGRGFESRRARHRLNVKRARDEFRGRSDSRPEHIHCEEALSSPDPAARPIASLEMASYVLEARPATAGQVTTRFEVLRGADQRTATEAA